VKSRVLKLTASAQLDLFEAWRLIAERDGEERADAVRSRIMAFLFGLAEFAEIGTRHDERRRGLRTSGIPGLRSISILFRISGDQVTVIAISYLGRDLGARLE
jgi:plasmid stabilization system protein ParE